MKYVVSAMVTAICLLVWLGTCKNLWILGEQD